MAADPHRRVPVLANVKTTGRYPVEYFWHAGGVPAVILELRDLLHLDCLTVTGKTLGENLEELEQNPFFFAERRGYKQGHDNDHGRDAECSQLSGT